MRSFRLEPLLAQFDTSWEFLRERLEGIDDAEFLWEPAADAFTVRRRDGRWVGDPVEGPELGSIRTIAWLAGHLGEVSLLRAEYTVGEARLKPGELEWPGTANEGVAFLREGVERWRRCLAEMSDSDATTVGRSQYPWGLDPSLPLIDIVWWQNRELIHHGAEMASLRDLYGRLRGPADQL